MTKNLGIIIVDKTGTLKTLKIKDYKEEELFKKCGFKTSNGFEKKNEWSVKYESKKYLISIYGKVEGKANMENKYDFPPPIDKILFFGSCAIVSKVVMEDKSKEYVSLSLEQWVKIYEKLFGGFESLDATMIEDEREIDDLDNIPSHKKTKHGYLKDGFVVDSDNEDNQEGYDSDYSSASSEKLSELVNEPDDGAIDIGIGSELSEDEYTDEE